MTEYEFALNMPEKLYTLGDVRELHVNPNGKKAIEELLKNSRGPWKSKSGGLLRVLFAVSPADAQTVLSGLGKYAFPISTTRITGIRASDEEKAYLPADFDIDGFRGYTVTEMPVGGIGGKEFHRIRHEIIFGFDGKVNMKVEDLAGAVKSFELNEEIGVYMPPFMMHTVESMTDKSGILVFCNTMLDPNRRNTYDTYSREAFDELQKKTKLSR